MSAKSQAARVYVVDDDQAVLRLLREAVEIIGVEVRIFDSAKEFLSAYQPSACQCLVCDIRMPDIDGMELQRRLKKLPLAPPIIFLTGFAEVNIAVEAMKQGAFDFFEKPFSIHALLAKIQAALDHSKGLHEKSLAQQAIAARLALLTPRERSIIDHVVAGRSSREISELLAISVRTVENHRTRIMEKLHVNSTVELIKAVL